MRAAATAVFTVLGVSAALAQSSTHHKTWPEALREQTGPAAIPPGWSTRWTPTVPIEPNPPEIVVIMHGPGGRVDEHNWRYGAYKRAGTKVEIRGPCYSACTLITAYLGKDKLCIADGAFLAFHAVRSASHKLMPAETAFMYQQFPVEIRNWIDRTGGYEHLPLDGFWPLRDRELWAMGYPRCP